MKPLGVESLQYPFSYVTYFIPEFITRMRRSKECIEKPSPRQSLAMYKLLLVAYLKKGMLDFQDLVTIAIVTSRVENQALAEKITWEILLNEKDEKQPSSEGERTPMNLLAPKGEETIYINEDEKKSVGEPQARFDSDIDIFKEFVNRPDLGVGPGEDELVKSYVRSMRKTTDERARRILSELLREMLLKLGKEFERRAESVHNPVLRPFEPGEDPELIDEESSLENLFEQGKRVDEIRYEDFLMRKKEKKRKVIVLVLDISNTMFYELEGLNSISHSVMSLIPLMWAVRREKYGLVLFESNTHVMKEPMEIGDEDALIQVLLSLVISTTTESERNFGRTRNSQFWGGTVPNSSLDWAYDKLNMFRDRSDKFCFFFSDLALEEPGTNLPEKLENYDIIDKMVKKGIRVFACVSPLTRSKLFAPYTEPVLAKIRQAGAEILETNRPSEFLDSVQAILEGK